MAQKPKGRYIYPVDLTGLEAELGKLAEKLSTSRAEAIRESIRHYSGYIEGIEILELRDIGKGQAKAEVSDYIEGRQRVTSNEVASALRLDMRLVNEALMELWQEGKVEPEED